MADPIDFEAVARRLCGCIECVAGEPLCPDASQAYTALREGAEAQRARDVELLRERAREWRQACNVDGEIALRAAADLLERQ